MKKNKEAFLTRASIGLTNPVARFSLMRHINPAIGVIFGVCALAGANDDGVLKNIYMPESITEAFTKTMQGPLLRGYKAGLKTTASLRTAAGSIGSNKTTGRIDQLANAVEFLKTERQAKIVLHDPAQKPDAKTPCMANLYIDSNECLDMDVWIDDTDVHAFACYVVPVFTFIQQVVAMLINAPLGNFIVNTEFITAQGLAKYETDYDLDDLMYYLKSFKRVTVVSKNLYFEKQAFDLRFIDNALRYLGDFAARVKEGDLLTANPFPDGKNLRLFYDCAEVLRAAEAENQKIDVKGDSIFHHPHLKIYFDK